MNFLLLALVVYLITKGAQEMFNVKSGADVRFLSATLWAALPRIEAIFEQDSPKEYQFVITSGTDGKHVDGSKHYTGNAVDVRIWYQAATGDQVYLSADVQQKIKADLDRALGSTWYTQIEPDHIHIQYNG
jgi:hypothetical protein